MKSRWRETRTVTKKSTVIKTILWPKLRPKMRAYDCDTPDAGEFVLNLLGGLPKHLHLTVSARTASRPANP